jgi:hypothetical protein
LINFGSLTSSYEEISRLAPRMNLTLVRLSCIGATGQESTQKVGPRGAYCIPRPCVLFGMQCGPRVSSHAVSWAQLGG